MKRLQKFILAAALALASPVLACPSEGICLDTLKSGCGTMQIEMDGKCVTITSDAPDGPSYSPATDRSWHLLTQSEGGTVSLLKGLTKHECEFAMHRAKGEPATDEEIAAEKKRNDAMWAMVEDMCANPKKYEALGGMGVMCDKNHKAVGYYSGGHSIGPGDIKSAECFQ